MQTSSLLGLPALTGRPRLALPRRIVVSRPTLLSTKTAALPGPRRPALPCRPLGRRHRVSSASRDADPAAASDQASASKPSTATESPAPEEPEPSSSPAPRPPRRSGSGQSWFERLSSKIKMDTPMRFLINLAMFLLLLRFLPFPGASSSPLSSPDGVVLRISFSEFIKSVKRNEVARVVVDGTNIMYALRPSAAMFKGGALRELKLDERRITFETRKPTDYPTPYDAMIANNVQISATETKGSLLSNIFTYALIALVLVAVLNRLPMKMGQRGPSKRHGAGSVEKDAHQITFADVAGVDEAKEELQEIVEYLRDPERFSKLGARPPSGVLLVGPPGTGKTLLAKAVAGEAGVPFFSIAASEFVELYVGMGALRVRELFNLARTESPAIVFIDEIDAIGKGRDSRLRSVGNDEREQTLNQLLTELDGFDSSKPGSLVICIAATNRPDVLDAALLRPGRFDRRVPVERPDRQGREEILRVHIEKKALPLGTDVDAAALAAQTAGFTGADLANIVNEAALLAGRKSHSKVDAADFDAAILRSVAGLEKKRSVLKGEEKAVVARHEVGHALVATAVAVLVPSTNPVERLSIIPRSGGALGFTYSPTTLATEDRVLLFENEIRGQLAMLMGGRAAEAVTSSSISSGASDDIRRATELAHNAVAEYGMSAAVGPVSVSTLTAAGAEYSLVSDAGKVGSDVETEVRYLCDEALQAAKDTIELNRALHASLSGELEREERLDGQRLRDALQGAQVPPSLREFVMGVGKASKRYKESMG